MFRDAHAYARKCEEFKKSTGMEIKHAFPIQPISIKYPFQQWGLYVIGSINPNSS